MCDVNLTSDLGIRSLFLQKYIPFPRFAALLRLSRKYEMQGVRKLLIHHVQKHYPIEMSVYELVIDEHGTAAEAAFTISPHPNEVLKLFWECEIMHCLPVAFYEATSRGINSLTSSKPNVTLPPEILTPALKALVALNSNHVQHIRMTVPTFRACALCRRANLMGVEHLLAPTKADLSLFPLRESGAKPEISRILCEGCVEELKESYCNFKYALWEDLPGMFALPQWGELHKHVILK